MDEKDKKIQKLEKDVKVLQRAIHILEQRLKLVDGKAIRLGESVRRAHSDIDYMKRRR